MASNGITEQSSGRNRRTVGYRSTSKARHSPAGSASGGGATPASRATAARSSARDTRVSIMSQTIARPTSGPHSAASSSTCTAAAQRAPSLLIRG